jgi:type IV pilus assembly protein PilA
MLGPSDRGQKVQSFEAKKDHMQKQKGFSLIELLIVVAIILIIASIAVPNLMRARIAANESAAASQLRTLNTAEISYVTTYPGAGYGTLLALGGAVPCAPSSATACLIDNSLATNYGGKGKNGYNFAINLFNTNSQYDATASPIAIGSSGNNSFCSIEDAVVRKDSTGANDSVHDTCGLLPSLGN